MALTFQRTYPPALPAEGPAFWFPFREGELLVQQRERCIAIIFSDEAGIAAIQPQTITYLGILDGKPCMACEVSAETPLPEGWKTLDLRSLYNEVDEALYVVAGYAFQIRCGSATVAIVLPVGIRPRSSRPVGASSARTAAISAIRQRFRQSWCWCTMEIGCC